jgi:hypothetical protein
MITFHFLWESLFRTPSTTNLIQQAEQVVTHQLRISFSIAFQHAFNRAGGRTSNVLLAKKYP